MMISDPNKPDPKLQAATKEITAICERYDIGGYIILASQTHGEYLLHFPKWSKAQMEILPGGKQAIRFRSRNADENVKELVTATIHMMQVFQIQGINIAKGMDELIEMLESKMHIGGGPKKI